MGKRRPPAAGARFGASSHSARPVERRGRHGIAALLDRHCAFGCGVIASIMPAMVELERRECLFNNWPVRRFGLLAITCALAVIAGPVHVRASHNRARLTICTLVSAPMPAVPDCTIDASITCPAATVASFSVFSLAMVACEVAPRLQERVRVSLHGGLHGP